MNSIDKNFVLPLQFDEPKSAGVCLAEETRDQEVVSSNPGTKT